MGLKGDHMSENNKVRDREIWSTELDWYLNCRDAACGVQSSFAAQVAAIERGGGGGGGVLGEDGSYVHPYNDAQVSNVKFGSRAFAMDRRMRIRWNALDTESKTILFIHYTGSFPEEVKGQKSRERWPKGVDARLGKLAGVALFQSLGERFEKVLKACSKGDDKALKGTLKRAEDAVRIAHRFYYALTDKEASAWASDRPTNPGITNVHEAPEPFWLGRSPPSRAELLPRTDNTERVAS